MVTRTTGSWRWEGVEVLPYKEDGTHFHKITRQVLFNGDEGLEAQFRYFEVGPGGHSTLERHQHVHAVMIIRGSGAVLVGDTITPIQLHDVVHIPPMTWHQFRAASTEELGFLCVVSCERDRPQRPTPDDLAALQQTEAVREFIRV